MDKASTQDRIKVNAYHPSVVTDQQEKEIGRQGHLALTQNQSTKKIADILLEEMKIKLGEPLWVHCVEGLHDKDSLGNQIPSWRENGSYWNMERQPTTYYIRTKYPGNVVASVQEGFYHRQGSAFIEIIDNPNIDPEKVLEEFINLHFCYRDGSDIIFH